METGLYCLIFVGAIIFRIFKNPKKKNTRDSLKPISNVRWWK